MKRPARSNPWQIVAPLLALVVLVVGPLTLPNHAAADEDVQRRREDVARTMSAVPRFVEDWTGRDRPVPVEAQRLLRPNAVFSRLYQRPGGERVHVMIVHCADARDMIGHYPPVCYPSAGWLRIPITTEAIVPLDLGSQTAPFYVYEFCRLRGVGQEERIRIFNAFVLPDGTVTAEIDDINRQSDRIALAVQGVAQVQVITDASFGRAAAIEAAETLLGGMSRLFEALQVE